MSLAQITLTTNKTVSNVGDYVRKIGQDERGQKLEVIVTDADGSGYNLDGKTLEFSENKEGGKIVSDNDQEHFEIKDAKAGRFVYTLVPAVYEASGVAWFDITSADGSVIDTTKNFNIDVIENKNIHVDNSNYVSNLVSLETHYDGVIKKAKEDSEALLAKINDQLSQALNDNNQKAANSLADQKTQLQKFIESTNQLQTDWNAQKVAIQKAADDQLKANKDANDAEIADVKKQLADELAKIDQSQFVSLNNMITALRTENNNLKQEVGNLKNKNAELEQEIKDSEIPTFNTLSEYQAWEQDHPNRLAYVLDDTK